MASQVNIIPTYDTLGFSMYLEKPLVDNFSVSQPSAPMQTSQINFDQVQTTGSLGDRIQIGGSNIIIDGARKRIIINDGTNDRIVIGAIDE